MKKSTEEILTQKETFSPMFYYTNLGRKLKEYDVNVEDVFERQGLYTQEIYNAMNWRSELGRMINQYSYGCDDFRSLARQVSKWVVMNVLSGKLITPEMRKSSNNSPQEWLLEGMASLYDALLLMFDAAPGGPEDRILRAFLDNRSKLETGHWQMPDICYVNDCVSRTSFKGDADRPVEMHEMIFAESAMLHFFEHKGEILFRGPNKKAPPNVFTGAFHRMFQAWEYVSWLRDTCQREGLDTSHVAEDAIKLIQAVHEENPLNLASGPAVYEFDYWGGLKNKLFPHLIE